MSEMIAEYVTKQDAILEEMKKTEENISNDLTTALDEVKERAKRMHEIIDDLSLIHI